jgi:hypothetical protein
LTVHSEVSSQDTPMYTSESLSSTLPIALDCTLPAYLALHSQVHSQEGTVFPMAQASPQSGLWPTGQAGQGTRN